MTMPSTPHWQSFVVDSTEDGLRLDLALPQRFQEFSRTYFELLIENQHVRVNGAAKKKRERLKTGDLVELHIAEPEKSSLTPEALDLDILYEDEALCVLNKPAGLVVHPAAGHRSGTLANALLHHCQKLPGDQARPGLVHRLDKDTSGLLVVAKTPLAHEKLIEAFTHRQIDKEYLAICFGKTTKGTLSTRLGRHPRLRQQMAVLLFPQGKEAITHVEPLGFKNPLSAVRLRLETGRTHQLRVHLQHAGTPILGDSVYGNEKANRHYGVSRQLLHAHRLAFLHPLSGEPLAFQAPLPQDFFPLWSQILPDPSASNSLLSEC